MNKKLKIESSSYRILKTFSRKIISKNVKYVICLNQFFGLKKKYFKIGCPNLAVNSDSSTYVSFTKYKLFATEMDKDLAERLIKDIYSNPDKYIFYYEG